tara:strand:+ start:312 stop:737 length:426 start_codon:yes stop_codon:yes gene_type:complete
MMDLEIIGNPTSQKRHRHTRWGTYDPSKKDKENFRNKLKIVYADSNCTEKDFPLDVPIVVTFKFYMKRPKSHFRSGKYSHLVKDNAPSLHFKKPDIDNLSKFVLDAGNGLLWKDDSLVVHLMAYKRYSEIPRTEINIINAQ